MHNEDSVQENIIIRGARVNNLRNLDVDIPRGKLVVVTGVSGSGKSSLAFDTLYAEGQRRFAESLSSYARQFLGRMSKPDVEMVDGIPPSVAIEQKVTIRNPRSTVATTTEIYDYIRLIFARIGKTYSPLSGRLVKRDSMKDVLDFVDGCEGTLYVLSDLKWDSREDHTELLITLKEQGYNRLFADGAPLRIDDALRSAMPSRAYLLVDRAQTPFDRDRLMSSINDAFERGEGRLSIWTEGEFHDFNTGFELDGIRFAVPDEYMFSFNSPLGACPVCGGLGKVIGISEDLVVPDKSKSIFDGAIACWRGDKMGWFKDHLIKVSGRYGIRPFEPYCNLTDKEKDIIWHGHSVEGDEGSIIGIDEFFEWVETQRYKIQFKYMLSRFSGKAVCGECGGSRLRKDALYVKLGGRNISEVLALNVDSALEFFRGLELSENERKAVAEPLYEVINRLECVRDVGLGYLTLDRACNTLSGGESQRINLVTALGSSLVGSMYILDEPSIGLHSRDTERLIGVLKRLRDYGNTVVVVEHDEEIIRAADVLIDMGPGAGVGGGTIVYQGAAGDATAEDRKASLTLRYLSGEQERYTRSRRIPQYSIVLKGVREHNLKGMDVKIPLGVLTVVTGVSGSGKSSLVGDILYPAMNRLLNDSGDLPGTFSGLGGNIDRIQRVEYVDQNPIGRSSRSNAVTYLKAYDNIRNLMSRQQYARINGYGPQYFSFNADAGRCPECQGEGVVRIEMQFMADVRMVCEECGGKRFKPDILEVRYRGRNIDDILNMSVSEALEFFAGDTDPDAVEIVDKLKPLEDVGLGYIKLGQSSSTLSGGESQRIKLAFFLSLSRRNKKAGRIMFIFDEPTTGLHFYDVEKLLKAFDALLSAGHSLVVVEHNPDVIRSADWVIDMGPDAGDRGGEVVFSGPPEELRKAGTFTSRYI